MSKYSEKFIKYEITIGSAKVMFANREDTKIHVGVSWDDDFIFHGFFPFKDEDYLKSIIGKYVDAKGIGLHIKETDELLDFEVESIELDDCQMGPTDWMDDWDDERKELHQEMMEDFNEKDLIRTKEDRLRLIEESKSHKIKVKRTTWYDKLWYNAYKLPSIKFRSKPIIHKIWDGSELEYTKQYQLYITKPCFFGYETRSLDKIIREIEDKPDKRWKEGNILSSAPYFELQIGPFKFSKTYEHDIFSNIISEKDNEPNEDSV